MKNIFKTLKLTATLLFLVTAFIACDKDFTSIESDIQGAQNFNTNSKKFSVAAYNKKINPVQTNNLSSNLLGIYKDAIYGLTTANVVSQVIPTAFAPDFGDSPEIESVILNIPYFVTNEGNDDDGNATYSLDSLYGNLPIKLLIYQNNYFLRDFEPDNIEERQSYYSNANQTINFDNHLGELLYNSDDDDENNNVYLPSPVPTIITKFNEETGEDEEVERIAPSLRVEFSNTNFWKTLLFDHQDLPELSNANNFKEFFRGLYFKTEAIDAKGNMMMLNFKKGTITINYTNLQTVDGEEERKDATYTLTFAGNILNTFENDPTNTIITNADTNANATEGDETLYLKGGEGSLAVINLFNGTILDEETGVDVPALDYFNGKKEKWLINEANLIFYVDQEQVLNENQEPERVLLYDLKNNIPIIDYFFDTSTNTTNPVNSKILYSKILERNEEGHGVKYKFRVTEHLNNILLRDSTNVKLGLVVTTNINEIANSKLINPTNTETVTKIPIGAVMSPEGTILHGSNPNVSENKRVELEIFYSEPNN